MALIKPCPKAKLFFAIIYKNKKVFEEAKKELKRHFGEFDSNSTEYSFNFTDYYEEEMGADLKKIIFSSKKLIKREKLSAIKLKTNMIEQKFAKNGKRQVNIDPGYLTDHNIVLASAKELPHRAYIGKGIFADIQLRFRNGRFEPFCHTFKDYMQKEILDYFFNLRDIYLSQLKNQVKN